MTVFPLITFNHISYQYERLCALCFYHCQTPKRDLSNTCLFFKFYHWNVFDIVSSCCANWLNTCVNLYLYALTQAMF